MRKVTILIVIMLLFTTTVSATEPTAPTVPEDVQEYMPADTESFGDGLWYVVKTAIRKVSPDLTDAFKLCIGIIGAAMLCAMLRDFPGSQKKLLDIIAVMSVSAMLFYSSTSMINLGVSIVSKLNDYGKLLLPVMTTALATQGGITSSTALYVGTVFFCTLLTSLVINILVPMLYIYLALSVANSALEQEILGKLRDFTKWLMVWCLKIILYVFTGYITITGVVSGTTDASVMKATKLTISGVVPVVGGILSDASESVLVSAGVMKNAAGVYGLIAVFAIWIGPFLRIGVHYILLKITSAISNVFGVKQLNLIINDFSFAMGFVVAMTGAICLMLLISLVCFMKGVG